MVVGKNEGGEQVMYGTCRFCGQIINVTFACEEGASEAEMNRQATLHCTCDGAQEYIGMEAAKVRAIDVIDQTISNEETKAALQTLVAPVCEKQVKNVVIDNGDGTKVSMRLNKRLVEVKVSRTTVETKC